MKVDRGTISDFSRLVEFSGFVYGRVAYPAYGYELINIDTSTYSIDLVSNSETGTNGYSDPEFLVSLQSYLFYAVLDGSGEHGIYLADSLGSISSLYMSGAGVITDAVALDTTHVILATDFNGNGTEPHVWSFNDGLSQLEDIYSGDTGSDPSGMIQFDGYVYFAATSSSMGRELYRASSSAVSLVADVNSGSSSSNPEAFAIVNGALYFAATSSSASGKELHVLINATTHEVDLVVDATSGSGDSDFAAGATGVGDYYVVAGSDSGQSGLLVYNVVSATRSYVTMDASHNTAGGDAVTLGDAAFLTGYNTAMDETEIYRFDSTTFIANFIDVYTDGDGNAQGVYIADNALWVPANDANGKGLYVIS